MKFGVVILAAGASRRMGVPKLTLPWAGRTVLAHLIALWQELRAAQIAVVTTTEASEVNQELDRIALTDRILNPHRERGMFSSIQSAARWPGWIEQLTHVIILLGDQPQICRGTLQTLLDFAAEHPNAITQPSYQGRACHPVALPFPALSSLAAAPEDSTLKDFISQYADHASVEIDDPLLALDLDHPEDYLRLLGIVPGPSFRRSTLKNRKTRN